MSNLTIFRVNFPTFEKKLDQVQVEFKFFNRVELELDSTSTRLDYTNTSDSRVNFRTSEKKLDRVRVSSFLIELSSNLALYWPNSITPLLLILPVAVTTTWMNMNMNTNKSKNH